MERAEQTTTVAAPLVELVRGRLDDEVQCPACGWVSRWVEVTDDVPTLAGPTCSFCGESWQLVAGAPARDTVVDATRANISRVSADRDHSRGG